MRFPLVGSGRSWSIGIPAATPETGLAESRVAKLALVPESLRADLNRVHAVGRAFAEDTAYLRAAVNADAQPPTQPTDPPRLPKVGGGRSWSIGVPAANPETGLAESWVSTLTLAPEASRADVQRRSGVGQVFDVATAYYRTVVNGIAQAPPQPPTDPNLDGAERPWKGPFF